MDEQNTNRKRDWRTPVLLTLSVHLLIFTLFINHRLFGLLEEPTPGPHITRVVALTGDDPDETARDEDPGAAPGDEAEPNEPARVSVSDLLREQETPVHVPLPPRERARIEPAAPEPDNPVPLADRLAATADTASPADLAPGDAPVAGGGSRGMRGEGRRDIGLRRHGGGSDTEDAVELGLAWLAGVQDHDGKWDSDGYMIHYLGKVSLQERMAEGVGYGRNNVGITGLCLMAFTGAGHTHRQGRYAENVRRATEWLLGQQRSRDGGFGLSDARYRVTFYGHSLATLALCDLYLLTGDPRLRAPAQRAVQYLCRTQGPGGGWDYNQHYPDDRNWQPSERDDLSITGWAVLALSAALEAGLEVPEQTLGETVKLLRRATRPDGEAVYANQGVRAGHRGMSMVAVSNLCRRLLGEDPDSEIQRRQVGLMSRAMPDWGKAGDILGSNMYYWYYGALAMLVARDMEGGETRWRQWNIELKRTLLPNQVQTGPRRGSFDPVCFWGRNGGGRLYSTAICVLTLQIYYRYEPEFTRAKAHELSHLWAED